jgi:hypothetical protein
MTVDQRGLEHTMTSVFSANKVALQVLQQPVVSSGAAKKTSVADAILSIANGNPANKSSDAQVSSQPTKTQSKDSDDLFGVNSVDITKIKLNLYKRLGQEIGINEDDYDTLPEYGEAIARQLKHVSPAALQEVAHKLGLDKMGVSIQTLIQSMVDPNGKANETLTKALEAYYNKDSDGKEKQLLVKPDDTGIYTISGTE